MPENHSLPVEGRTVSLDIVEAYDPRMHHNNFSYWRANHSI